MAQRKKIKSISEIIPKIIPEVPDDKKKVQEEEKEKVVILIPQCPICGNMAGLEDKQGQFVACPNCSVGVLIQ